MDDAGDISDKSWVASRLGAGDTVTAIAETAGVSRQTASSWLKRHGLTARKRPLERPSAEQLAADYDRHDAIRPMATEYGISPATMRTWLFEAGVSLNEPGTSGGRPRIDIDVDELRRLRDSGETLTAIAKHLDVPYETIRRRLAERRSDEEPVDSC